MTFYIHLRRQNDDYQLADESEKQSGDVCSFPSFLQINFFIMVKYK